MKQSLVRRCFVLLLALLLMSVSVLFVWPTFTHASTTVVNGLHISGNQLLNGANQPVRSLGVDRAGTEYQCPNGSVFDGPSDAASVSAMASWHINTVRIPLNEDCWLGINGLPGGSLTASGYQQAIVNYVNLLNSYNMEVVLDLHWNASGTNKSTAQQAMPDADHAPAFWTSVASTFASNTSVMFDLYNEPYPSSWSCWLNGSTAASTSPCSDVPFAVAGMQSLVNTVRATGATNVLLAGGLSWSNDLSGWLANKPNDPQHNLAASFHLYNFNGCNTTSCFDSQIAPVAAQVPVIVGELGEKDCSSSFINSVMPWLDQHNVGYLGWAWNTQNCSSFPALISNYDGTPTAFGLGLQQHLATLASATPTPVPTTPTPTPGVIAQDTFQRANQTYWGTASDGQTWGGDANTASNFSISNNAGLITSGNAAFSAILGPSESDSQVLFSGSLSSFSNSNLGEVLRWTDTNNWYKAYIDGTNLVIQKKVAGTTTYLSSTPFAASTGISYSIRFQIAGTTLSVRAWPTSSSEPATWTSTVTDSSLSSGNAGLRIQVNTGVTATVTSFVALTLQTSVTPTPTPAPSIIAQDTFQRANQTYWGTASDGQTWGGDANTASNFSIINDFGWIDSSSGPQDAILGPSVTDANVFATGYIDSFTNANFGVVLRWTDTNNWYKAYFDGTSLIVQKKVNGTTTILASTPFAAQLGTSYNLLFQVFGSTLTAKIWAVTDVEPDVWMVNTTDSSLTSGHAGLRIQALNGPAQVTAFLATTTQQ